MVQYVVMTRRLETNKHCLYDSSILFGPISTYPPGEGQSVHQWNQLIIILSGAEEETKWPVIAQMLIIWLWKSQTGDALLTIANNQPVGYVFLLLFWLIDERIKNIVYSSWWNILSIMIFEVNTHICSIQVA